MDYSLMPKDCQRVIFEGWRIVRNPKRARKLRNRGERVQWSEEYNAWIWEAGKFMGGIFKSKYADYYSKREW